MIYIVKGNQFQLHNSQSVKWSRVSFRTHKDFDKMWAIDLIIVAATSSQSYFVQIGKVELHEAEPPIELRLAV